MGALVGAGLGLEDPSVGAGCVHQEVGVDTAVGWDGGVFDEGEQWPGGGALDGEPFDAVQGGGEGGGGAVGGGGEVGESLGAEVGDDGPGGGEGSW